VCVSWVKDLWIVYMNIFDILIHDITNINVQNYGPKMVLKYECKKVFVSVSTNAHAQANTMLKSHIRLTIVFFNKLYIILDILGGGGKVSVSNVQLFRVLLQQPLFSGDVVFPRLVVVSLMLGWVLFPVWLKLREGRGEQ
jgi:hypothetical protein